MNGADSRKASAPDRRALSLTLAGVALSACAGSTPMLVNLADTPPVPGAPRPDVVGAGADLAARMTVPVTLNGEGPFQFVVDSGANHSVLALETAQAIGLQAVGSAAVHGIAGVEPAPVALVNRLTVGEVTLRRIRTPLLPRFRLGADGLLGVDALRGRRVRLDFRENRLVIASGRDMGVVTAGRTSRLSAEAEEIVVPARFRFGQLIIIDADVAGQKVTCFLDSGSQNTVGNLALRRALGQIDPRFGEQRVIVQLVSATGQTASGESLRLPGLRLGGLRIGNMNAVFADLHVFKLWDLLETPSILLGVDVMRHFMSIDLDFAQRRVVFRTPRAPLPPEPVG